MKRFASLVFFGVLATAVESGLAQPWDFGEALDITQTQGGGTFHHLESSGRRNIDISNSTVAVVWEDDRDGIPRIYLARKETNDAQFGKAVRVSGEGEAYEPSLAALDNDRFVVAWEEDGHIYGRIISAQQLGPPIKLSDSEAVQANVSVHDKRIYVLRSQREERFNRIHLHVLRTDSAFNLTSEADCVIDMAPAKDDQFYPVSAVVVDELVVAWEDRRAGHTIIMASISKLDDVCSFKPPIRISEPRPGPESGYGKGHGVARVTLSSFGKSDLIAVWADKRNYWEGYDIYAARYLGDGRFGPNIPVQDEFGDFARQWHASVTGNTGRVVVAWNDEREGNSDVMLSWIEGGEWSEDLELPNASGPGHQTHPSIAMDVEGNLHMAWIERSEVNGLTRLRYQFGRVTEE